MSTSLVASRRHFAGDAGAVVASSLAGGAAFLLLQMILVPALAHGSAWDPFRWAAALVLGQRVVGARGASFDLGLVAVGLAVHLTLSLTYGTILLRIVERWFRQVGPALIAGALFGFVLYVVNLGILVAVFPWFADASTGVGLISHLAFGLLTVKAYLTVRP